MIDLRNKRIAVLGFGIDTSDLIAWFLEQGISFTVCDENESVVIPDNLKSKSELRLGKDAFAKLTDFDVIVRNPAIYRYRKEIIEAENKGVEITSKIKIFFDLCPAKIIGVTGTKGKGTTSTLVYQILRDAGKEVFIGGNIGLGIFDFLPTLTKNSWVVLEMSSFQLIDLHKSPHIGVHLMTTTDHLDWHVSSEEYVRAKGNIFKWQKLEDFAVVNADYPNSRKNGELGAGKKYFFSRKERQQPGAYLKDQAIYLDDEKLIDISEIRLRGEHNQENIMAAALAARLAGVNLPTIVQTIKNFRGLEHRLEEVATVGGVTYFNDSFSTVPETAIAAVKAFKEPIILIAGGSDKGSDFTELGKVIAESKNVKAVILIGLMTEKIREAIHKHTNKPEFQIVTGLKTMKEIVKTAKALAKAGDVVLLSPAAASFDMFKSYKHRGQEFKEQVLKLADYER